MPVASIVMPCFNAAEFVRNSVAGILLQSFSDLELIVVDDCSSDGSARIVQEMAEVDPRVRLIVHSRNFGASRSRNDGIRAATGDFVGFCDADDVWKPVKLERQITTLRANPSYDVAFCDAEIIDQNGRLTGEFFSTLYRLPKAPSGNLFERLCLTNFINTQTVMVRRRAFSSSSILFDENIKWVEDWWQWIQLSHNHLFIFDAEPLAQYRVHEQNTRVTQRTGISLNRWKVSKRTLQAFPELSRRIKAAIWYQMGLECAKLHRPRLARKYLCRSVGLGLLGGSSPRKQLAMTSRLVLEYCRVMFGQA